LKLPLDKESSYWTALLVAAWRPFKDTVNALTQTQASSFPGSIELKYFWWVADISAFDGLPHFHWNEEHPDLQSSV